MVEALVDQRKYVYQSIELYEKLWKELSEDFLKDQLAIINQFKAFTKAHEDAFERSNFEGHFTASGFIISEDFSQLLMVFHKKLNKWMQLGGHADGDPILHEVALKESIEESGLESFTFYKFPSKLAEESGHPLIFDLDLHQIPKYEDIPAHPHYDVRYLLIADNQAPLVISDESLDLKWIDLNQVTSLNPETSIARPIQKIQMLYHAQCSPHRSKQLDA